MRPSSHEDAHRSHRDCPRPGRTGARNRSAAMVRAEAPQSFGRLRARASSTAMRTATPISTCSRIKRLRTVGDGGVDLDAPVHRPWMHHQRIGFRIARAFPDRARNSGNISRLDGNEAAIHSLALQAQHHDDVGALQPLPSYRCRTLRSRVPCDALRHQGRQAR